MTVAASGTLALAGSPADPLGSLRERVRATVQHRPGVYQFLDPAGSVFYVGKAKDLRSRLLSYFTAPFPDSKGAHLIRAAADVSWRYLPSEFAALLEELRLIARLRPFSNVRGTRTRRRVTFIKLTGGPAPRLKVTEHTTDRAARYWGPFQSHGRTTEGIRVLADLLGLRDCAQDRPIRFAGQAELFAAPAEPAGCLRHTLGTCHGPCAARCTGDAYRAAAQAAVEFLESRSAQPLDRVLDTMAAASGAQDYERAALWRDKLEALEFLFASTARLRAATEALSFVYRVREQSAAGALRPKRRGAGAPEGAAGGAGSAARSGTRDDRAYLIHRGLVKEVAPWPSTPLEREAFAASVARHAALPPGGPAARTAPEMDELLLVMSWFRQRPGEFSATVPLERRPAAARR